jgi:hypothetical protein
MEPLLVAVDPQDLRIRFQAPTIVHTPAEKDFLQLIFWGKSGLYVLRVEGISVVGV